MNFADKVNNLMGGTEVGKDGCPATIVGADLHKEIGLHELLETGAMVLEKAVNVAVESKLDPERATRLAEVNMKFLCTVASELYGVIIESKTFRIEKEGDDGKR